jgi:hypothetical protein
MNFQSNTMKELSPMFWTTFRVERRYPATMPPAVPGFRGPLKHVVGVWSSVHEIA